MIAGMSFRAYIQSRRITDTPAGDFTADARADKAFPDARSWTELRRYLERRGAIREAVEAGHRVWAAYRAQVRKNPTA